MKVLVCGGRGYENRAQAFDVLDKLHARVPIGAILHGACCDEDGNLTGADKLAELWAIVNQIPYGGYPAKWKKNGRAAGPIRNKYMADLCPAKVVALPGGRGTASMVKIAKAAEIEVIEILD